MRERFQGADLLPRRCIALLRLFSLGERAERTQRTPPGRSCTLRPTNDNGDIRSNFVEETPKFVEFTLCQKSWHGPYFVRELTFSQSWRTRRPVDVPEPRLHPALQVLQERAGREGLIQ